MDALELSRRRHLAQLAKFGLLGLSSGAGIARAQGVSGSVVIYSSNNTPSGDTVKEGVRKALAGVKVDIVTGGSLPLLKRIETEAASKPQADLFWSSTANVMENFRKFYEPYKSPETGALPPALVDSQLHWAGANTHIVVLMVNLRRLGSEVPRNWADLTDARFKGKVIIADPGNSSTAYTSLWGADQLLGAAGLAKLAANVTVTPQASNVVRAVAQGEYSVGITFESTAYSYVAGGQKEIKLVYPGDGTFTAVDNVALVKGAPNMPAAKKVYDLLLSKNLQTALLENAFRRPSRKDIDVSKYVDMPPMAQIKIVPTDDVKAAAGRDAFMARWRGNLAAGRS